jgi:hypothetical protein
MKSSDDLSLAALAREFSGVNRTYSPAPIWWWSAEKLDRSRLRWQLEQFAAGGVYNLVILNLAPTGPLYGSDADDPPFFSEAWWDIFLGVCADARELGVRLWFYDQIGFSGANLQGGLVRENPGFAGQWLASQVVEGAGPLQLSFPPEGTPLAVAVTNLATGETVTRTVNGSEGAGHSQEIPELPGGAQRLRVIYAVRRGFDYFGKEACATLLNTVHAEFAQRAHQYFGDVIVGSFQDELPSMPTWGSNILAAFAARNGYDLAPELGLLWEGDGEEAQRVRTDFHATRAALAEEAFFKPLFAWHEQYGLICGFDQQGPARAGDPVETVTLYADYLKTHRWFGAPGSDHHGEAKIHSSLAHLYDRPRVWIESFHSSGWGGTLEETFDWLLPWLRAGANLYDPHAVYYSTRGGWWEWAPPSTCWRQPYWRHYSLFAGAVSRLCYLLSQGDHLCDIGVLFPTVTVQAHTTPDGARPRARQAHDTYVEIVGRMVWFDAQPGVLDQDRRDYDILDDDSLQRATVENGVLSIGREHYRAIVLPGCVTLAGESAEMLARFAESGGLLIAIGDMPEFTAADGQQGVAQLRALFANGRAQFVAQASDLPQALASLPRRVDAPVPTLHRRIDGHDVLFVPATASRASDVRYQQIWWNVDYDFDPLRYAQTMVVRVQGAQGTPQLWNPLDGTRHSLAAQIVGEYMEVEIPFNTSPAAVIVWGEEDSLPASPSASGKWTGFPEAEAVLATPENWQAQLEPTLDNRYGDFDRPAFAGAPPLQTWRFEHRTEDPAGADTEWQTVEATFGTYGWFLGPQPLEELPDPASDIKALQQPGDLHAAGWKRARYSLTRGIAHDRVHTWTLGPKGHVPYEFLEFGAVHPGQAVRFRTSVVTEAGAELHFALAAGAAKRLWVNGKLQGEGPAGYLWLQPLKLHAGANLIEWELAPEQAVYLRAMWALVREPQRFVRPEWMAPVDAPVQDSLVRFSGSFHVPFEPTEGTLHAGTAFGSRVLVNGVEIGRQGGFDPYGFQMRIYRHTSNAFRQGENTVTLEVHDPGRVVEALADVRVLGAHGEEAQLSSGAGWQVQRGDGPTAPAALHRFQNMSWNTGNVGVTIDPQPADVWRRPHPLPGAHWLEDMPGDGTVVPVVPDAFGGQPRVEWLRWVLPPGAQALHIPVEGEARLWIDDLEIPLHGGVAAVPPSTAIRRVATLRVEPRGGHSEGGLLGGPVTCTVEKGPIALGPWAEFGLAAYSGGLHYESTFTLTSDQVHGPIMLDLGRVRGTAEVQVNGQVVGARIWSPYRFDVTEVVRAGENQVSVLVLNTLAPYLQATSPTHYVFAGQEVSGLLGPVRVLKIE